MTSMTDRGDRGGKEMTNWEFPVECMKGNISKRMSQRINLITFTLI